MNILEKEDIIKGLPDNVLMHQAQHPTGELPEFLVVSEIKRREKMRKNYAEAVPENSIKDQVISSGIAAMNPDPDPLMASAMGAQDPMMGQMQEPMQQQMPMQDPMMQQQMMAAGGGMMPYRMDQGRGVPSDPRIAYYSMPESVKRTIDSGKLDADGMNQFMGVLPEMRGVTAENYYQIVDYLRASGHDVSKIPSSKFDRRDSVNMESLQRRYGIPTEAPEPPKPSSSQEGMSQIDAQYEAEYGESIKDKEAQQQFYRSDIPVAKEFEDDIPAVSLVEDNRSVADMLAGVQPRGLETMMLQRSGARSMLPGLEMSTEMMTETGLDSMVRNYQNDSMPRITSLLDSSEKIAPTFATTKAPNKNNYSSQFQRAETLLAELDRTRKQTDEAGLPRPSVDSNAMREDLAKGVIYDRQTTGSGGEVDPILLKYITAKEAGTTKVNERVEERQAEALDVANEMSNALYEIQKGDTLYGLSRERGTTVDDIMALNPQIEDRDLIYAGDTLNLSGGGITPHRMYGGLGSKVPSSYGSIQRFLKELNITPKMIQDATPEQMQAYEAAVNDAVGRANVSGSADLEQRSYPVTTAGMFGVPAIADIGGPYTGSYDSVAKKKDIDEERKALKDGFLTGENIGKTFDTNVLAAKRNKEMLPFRPQGDLTSDGASNIYEFRDYLDAAPIPATTKSPSQQGLLSMFQNRDAEAGESGSSASNPQGLDLSDFPAAPTIDLSGVVTAQKASPLDYLKFRVPYEGLLDKEEARSKLASEEARRDAGSNALIQLGAGIAAGDLSKGLSEAGKVAMLGKKDARAEDRNLSALKRQIELADRTQKSTLGIRGMEAKSKQDIALSELGVRAAEYAYKENTDLRAGYIELQKLKQKYSEAENRQPYYDALAQNAESLAKSREFDSLYSPAFIDANIRQLLMDDKTGELSLQLSGMSDPQRRDWWKRTQATQVLGGTSGGMSSDASGYTIESSR